MERHALLFRIKPGTRDRVARILAGYEPPLTAIDEDTRLLGTTVFLHGELLVRVMEIEGSLPKVAAHLSRQPQIQAVERALGPCLAEPRDMRDPAAAQAFFRRSLMTRLTHRAVDADGPEPATRHALLYPLRHGSGAAAEPAFRGGGDPPPQAGTTRLLSTSVFRHGDDVVRMFEIVGELDEAIEHLVRAAALRAAGQGLGQFLRSDLDLATEGGLRRFFREQLMTVVTDRRAERVA